MKLSRTSAAETCLNSLFLCSYFIARNFLPPLLPILTASLSRFSGASLPNEGNPPRASTPGLEKGDARSAAVEREGLDAATLEGSLAVAALAVKHNCGGDEKVLAMQEDLVSACVILLRFGECFGP